MRWLTYSQIVDEVERSKKRLEHQRKEQHKKQLRKKGEASLYRKITEELKKENFQSTNNNRKMHFDGKEISIHEYVEILKAEIAEEDK